MDAAGLSITDFVDVGIECTLRQLLEVRQAGFPGACRTAQRS
jgi:hypothetical protein